MKAHNERPQHRKEREREREREREEMLTSKMRERDAIEMRGKRARGERETAPAQRVDRA
jgi:hypothetical protein